MIERLLAAEHALERDDLDHAQRLFGQVAEADPRNAIAVVGLARVLALRGDTDAARELVTHALEIDPDEAAAQRLRAELDARDAVPSSVAEPQAGDVAGAPLPTAAAPGPTIDAAPTPSVGSPPVASPPPASPPVTSPPVTSRPAARPAAPPGPSMLDRLLGWLGIRRGP